MSAHKNKQRDSSRGRRRRGTVDDALPLHRRQGSDRGERVIYVATEGELTEPDYLEYLDETFGPGAPGRRAFRLHPIFKKNGLKPSETVTEVLKKAGTDEAWVLFDRDGPDRDDDIHRALRNAAQAKVEVGFSHPSFDLWLLLHFQSFTGAQRGSSQTVVDKLRGVSATTAFRDYASRDKGVKSPARRTALNGNEQQAVDNARALVKHCEQGGCRPATAQWIPVSRKPPQPDEQQAPVSWQGWSARSGHTEQCPILGRDPSSDVWRLLVSLGIATVR